MATLAELRSVELLNEITKGLDFSIPDIDFNDEIFQIPDELKDALLHAPDKLKPEDLTERVVNGMGMYDQLMTTNRAHLMDEYENGRITGAEYTKAYIALSQSALQYAVQYLLGRDQAYYQALGSTIMALKGAIDVYTAKVQLAIAQAQAHQNKAQYAGTVMSLAVNDSQRDLLIQQEKLAKEQTEQVHAQTSDEKLDGSTSVTGIMGGNINLLKQQKLLTVEQTEQTHAQTSDTKLDGTTPVTGYTGHQNALLAMQKQAFKNDAVIKGAMIYTDSFGVQASMGTASVAGTGLAAADINTATTKLQQMIAKNSD
ncbi:MAG: hypothetical protein IJV29_15400 [Butyrivibrio sp.]|nr:hypothetical protein [Butyrivibrio sp.]